MPTLHNNTQQLCEHIYDWRAADVEIDRSNRLVRNIALTGRRSKNGYRYSDEALKQAVPLYENKPVFLDHAANLARPQQRSTRDLVGSIVNARYADGRVRGDIQLLDAEAGRTFLALAESRSTAVGMSHVVLARRNRDQSVVESIQDVVSVDAVVFPATSSTFSESEQTAQPAPLAGSVEDLLAQIDHQLPPRVQPLIDNPAAHVQRRAVTAGQIVLDVAESETAEPSRHAIDWSIQNGELQFGAELKEFDAEHFDSPGLTWMRPDISSLQAQLDEANRENDRLQEQIDRLESERMETERDQEIDRLLAESNLPEAAVTELFRQQLETAPDHEARLTLINERQQLLEPHIRKPPHSRERDPTGNEPTDEQFIATLRRTSPTILRRAA